MSKAIKLVIFDLDGTLVDAYQAVSDSVNHALKCCGLQAVDDYTIKRSVGWGERVLLEKLVGQDHVDQVLGVYQDHHKEALSSGTTFLAGAKDLLDYLKQEEYLIGLATNRPSYFTHIILRHLAIDPYFDKVICADELDHPKPAPDMLEEILNAVAISSDEAVYVGDMTIDVETGKRAGVRTISVITGSSTQDEIAALRPYAMVDSLDQIKGILKQSK